MIICQSSSRLVGYARVSTTDQELCLQIDALRQHGVKKEHLFCDKISGARKFDRLISRDFVTGGIVSIAGEDNDSELQAVP